MGPVTAVAVGEEVGKAVGTGDSVVGAETGSVFEAGAGVPVAVAPQEMTRASKSAGKKARRVVNGLPLIAWYPRCKEEASLSVSHVRVNQAAQQTMCH